MTFNALHLSNDGRGLQQFRRRDERRDCMVSGVLSTAQGQIACRVVNLSVGGVAFVLEASVRLRSGERISIATRAFGSIDCVVRWGAHPKYGAEFSRMGKLPAAVQSFYDDLSSEA